MSGLVDQFGRPISSAQFKKTPPPKSGEIGTLWAGRDRAFMQLPGGAMLQFDLSKLTLNDFRAMRDHYQINANLMVLQFMMGRLDWRIACYNKKIRTKIEDNLRKVWPRLTRALSQAYWAGYAPNVMEFENDETGTTLNKIKDLVPEECRIQWKYIDGWAPPGSRVKPKVKIYDGIKQWGMPWPIPVENSFWYPLLMENGNMYGRKLLRPAFPSWYFSILMHLFANRYYERFGEPVPIGRAPDGDTLTINGEEMSSREAMQLMLQQLRSRAVVVLPSDRSQVGSHPGSSTMAYDYSIEYLESQMRGADFERYLTRLDEEISLSLFTPILLLRTADVGSYNLGVGHMQLFMWMLNALAGDLQEYINRYIVTPLKNYNFGPNAPEARWVFNEMGKQNAETMRAIVTAILGNRGAKPDLEQLSDVVGIDFAEVKQLAAPPTSPNDPNAPANPEPVKPGSDPRQRNRGSGPGNPRGLGSTRSTTRDVSARIREQVLAAYKKGQFTKDWTPSVGFTGKLKEALKADGYANYEAVADDVITRTYEICSALAQAETANPTEYMQVVDSFLESEVESLAAS